MKFTFPHWLIAVVTIVLGSLPAIAAQFPGAAPYLSVAQTVLPIILGALGLTTSSAVSAVNARACAAKVAGSMLALVALVVLCAGCLDAPIVPVTPANAAQVSSCQQIATVHNDLVFGDYVFGAGGAAVGVVGAALPSPNASGKTDLAISGAVLAALAATGAGVAALETRAFVADQCATLVEPLFNAHAPARTEQP